MIASCACLVAIEPLHTHAIWPRNTKTKAASRKPALHLHPGHIDLQRYTCATLNTAVNGDQSMIVDTGGVPERHTQWPGCRLALSVPQAGHMLKAGRRQAHAPVFTLFLQAQKLLKGLCSLWANQRPYLADVAQLQQRGNEAMAGCGNVLEQGRSTRCPNVSAGAAVLTCQPSMMQSHLTV